MPMNDTSERNAATARSIHWRRPELSVKRIRRRIAARFRIGGKFQRRANAANRHGPELETPVIVLGLVYAAAILLMIARLIA
jgi:hypothetical protein